MPGYLSKLLFPNAPPDMQRRKTQALLVFLLVVVTVCAGVVCMLWFSYKRPG